MISDRMYQILGKLFHFAAWWGVFPYDWDCNARHIVRSPRGNFYTRIHFFHICFGLFIYLLMCSSSYLDGNRADFSLSYSITLAGLLLLQLWVMEIFWEDDIFNAINSFFFYVDYINRKYLPNYNPNKERYNKIVEAIAVAIILGFLCIGVLTSCCVLLFPHSPMNVGYIVPEDGPLILKIPICYILPCFYLFILILHIVCVVCILLTYGAFVVPFLLHEFRLDHPPYNSIPELRNPENLMLAYRTAQVFLNKTVSVVVLFMFPTQSIVYKMVVFTSYMVLKYGKEMGLLYVVMFVSFAALPVVYWSSTLEMGGQLHSKGKCILMSWKCYNKWPDKFTKRMMSKFRRSCKPFQFNCGNTYAIKRLTVLKFLRSLSRGILKALLAL